MRTLDEWIGEFQREGGDQERAGEALGEALGHSDEVVRERAAGLVIEALGKAAPEPRARLLNLLQVSWWPPTARNAGAAFRATHALLVTMNADDSSVLDVMFLWPQLARVDEALIPAMTQDLKHARASVRLAAAGALGRVGERAVPSVSALIERLTDPEAPVRETALESLSALAPLDPERALPALEAEIRKGPSAQQFLAMTALRGLLEDARRKRKTVPGADPTLETSLLEVLENDEAAARLQAASLLGLCDFKSDETQSALRASLEDDSVDVQVTAAVSLLRLKLALDEARTLLQARLLGASVEDAEATLVALETIENRTLRRAHAVLQAAVGKLKGPLKRVTKELLVRSAPRAAAK